MFPPKKEDINQVKGKLAMTVSIVVPIHNNENTINELCERLLGVVLNYENSEVILVDDGSADESWSVIKSNASLNSKILGIKLSRNFGQHAAIEAGLLISKGTYLGMMDADLQEFPEEFIDLLEPLINKSHDIVIGATVIKKSLLSKLFHIIYKSRQGDLYPISQRVFTRQVMNALLERKTVGTNFGLQLEQIGFRKKYIEVKYKGKRETGKSSYTLLSKTILALKLMSSLLIQKLAFLALLSFGLSFVTSAYGILIALGKILLNRELGPGLNLVQITILIGFSGIFLILTAILLLLQKIENEYEGSPRYIIQETTQL
jgi:dolichol-phosphate mannosyltransferase